MIFSEKSGLLEMYSTFWIGPIIMASIMYIVQWGKRKRRINDRICKLTPNLECNSIAGLQLICVAFCSDMPREDPSRVWNFVKDTCFPFPCCIKINGSDPSWLYDYFPDYSVHELLYAVCPMITVNVTLYIVNNTSGCRFSGRCVCLYQIIRKVAC